MLQFVASTQADQVVFQDAAGRTLTTRDVEQVTGQVPWTAAGRAGVPEEAVQLHQKARMAGTKGDHRRALALLDRARALAPGWPHPVYDAAVTRLLQGDAVAAEELYAEVDRLAPRGFFTCKATLDSLRRERTGALPAGFSRAFTTLEWLDDLTKKQAILEGIVEQYPAFAPAWKELAALLKDADARWQAITKGLGGSPDGDTRGMLLIGKALILVQRGEQPEAIRILGELALDPQSTLAAETLAKAALARVAR